jgi:UDP-N-acetylglucosamine--N-acetylmuramyl-(pentapeptide) pyrophosphoryl-undecaprenol N-acetylglucosamine transferase
MTPAPIVICTGPTGGHFFPAAAFAEALSEKYPEAEIHFLMNRVPPFAQDWFREHRVRLNVVPLSPLPSLFSLKGVRFLIECAHAFLKTIALFVNLKPRFAAGFGSLSTVPGVLCAAVFRIPILLHEQNARAGRANQLLAFCADRIAVSFPETEGIPFTEKIIWSGFPVRRSFCAEEAAFPSVIARSEATKQSRVMRLPRPAEKAAGLAMTGNEQTKPFTLLVFGGSQGAERVNQVFLDSLALFSIEERNQVAVIHIIGREEPDLIQARYQSLNVRAEVHRFSEHIVEFYRRADLILSRAGAGTIFELAALGRAAILIPYPHAYAHQRANAEYLVRIEAARVIFEEELTPGRLQRAVLDLYRNPDKRMNLARQVQRLHRPEANQILTETIGELIS